MKDTSSQKTIPFYNLVSTTFLRHRALGGGTQRRALEMAIGEQENKNIK